MRGWCLSFLSPSPRICAKRGQYYHKWPGVGVILMWIHSTAAWHRPLGNGHAIKEGRGVQHWSRSREAPHGLQKRGKDHPGPDCVLKVCSYSLAQLPYSLGFHFIRCGLPTASSVGSASPRVGRGKIIRWEISKCPQGKSFEILLKCFVLIYIGKVPIIKLISCNSIYMSWNQIFTIG